MLVPVRLVVYARSEDGITTLELEGQSLKTRTILDRLEAALWPNGPMSSLPTGTVSFLFTDIEGSTRLLQELNDEGFSQVQADH